MKRLDIKADAQRDLAEIADYSYHEFGPHVGADYLRGLRAAFVLLLEFPEIGSVFEGVKPIVRLKTYRSHRIFYRVTKTDIVIVRVLHKARDARGLLN